MSDERKPLVPLYSDEYLEGEKYRHADTLSNGTPTYMDWDCMALIHVKSMRDEYEKDRQVDQARIAELERQLAAQEASRWEPLSDGTHHTDGPELIEIKGPAMTVYAGGVPSTVYLPYDYALCSRIVQD